MSIFVMYINDWGIVHSPYLFGRTFSTRAEAEAYKEQHGLECVIEERVDLSDDVRFIAYLTAERDGFSKNPDHYWFGAEGEIYGKEHTGEV